MNIFDLEKYRWIGNVSVSPTAKYVLVLLVHHTIDGKRINCAKQEIVDLHKISLAILNSCLQELREQKALMLKPNVPIGSPWLTAVLLPQRFSEV